MRRAEVGDLLKVDSATAGRADPTNYIEHPPGWAIVTHVDDRRGLYVEWLVPKVDKKRVPYLNVVDDFEVCSVDDLPAPVVAELTRMRLMGELEDG